IVGGRPHKDAAVSSEIDGAGPGAAVRRPRKINMRPVRSSKRDQRRKPRITTKICKRLAGAALKNVSVELPFRLGRLHDPEIDADDPGGDSEADRHTSRPLIQPNR